MEETIRRYGDLLTEPGEKFQYSNLGYGVLEYALETVGERDFASFMEDEVFLPLGLHHTAIVLDAEKEERSMAVRYDRRRSPIPFYDFDHRGASAVYGSVHDLVRFGMFHVGTPLDGQERILSKRALSEMQRPKARMHDGGGYGIGWMVYELEHGGRLVEHGGGMPGVSTLLQLIPSRKIVVVTLASTSTHLARDVAEEVLSELMPRGVRVVGRVPRYRTRGSAKPPRAYRGIWEGEVYTYEGVVPLHLSIDEDTGLSVRLNGRDPVSPVGVVFRGKDVMGVVQVELGTSDTRGAEALRFELSRDGEVLRGTVAAVASGNDGFPLALSHWTVLRKATRDAGS